MTIEETFLILWEIYISRVNWHNINHNDPLIPTIVVKPRSKLTLSEELIAVRVEFKNVFFAHYILGDRAL